MFKSFNELKKIVLFTYNHTTKPFQLDNYNNSNRIEGINKIKYKKYKPINNMTKFVLLLNNRFFFFNEHSF